MAPKPEMAAKLTRRRMEGVLHRNRIRRLTADQVVAALRTPALELVAGSADAASEQALLLWPRLRLLKQPRTAVAARREARLDERMQAPAEAGKGAADRPTDVAILRSLPGVGRVSAATLLAEASQAIADRDDGA